MNKNTGKSFDAVAESRKWREEASRVLDAMDAPTRLAYLAGLYAKLPPKRSTLAGGIHTSAVVREDSPPYGTSVKEVTP